MTLKQMLFIIEVLKKESKKESKKVGKKVKRFNPTFLLQTFYWILILMTKKIARLVKVPLAFVQMVKDEKSNFVSVTRLVLDTKFDDAKISRLLNVSLAFVKKVRLIVTPQE
jgi:hypothetical protein